MKNMLLIKVFRIVIRIINKFEVKVNTMTYS